MKRVLIVAAVISLWLTASVVFSQFQYPLQYPPGSASGGGTPSGAAGGGLAGTYPNPTIANCVTAGRVWFGGASAGQCADSTDLTLNTATHVLDIANSAGALRLGGSGALTQNGAQLIVANNFSSGAESPNGFTVASIPRRVFVTSDFTTSGVGTALEAITGLTWTFPATTAVNVSFHCDIVYHQNAANAAVAFGTQNATTAPTNYGASGRINTSATVFAAANVVANTATTAVSVVSGTPSAITTNWNAELSGTIEQPSGSASVFTIRVSTATAADTVTVLRGSFCQIN